MRTYHASRSDRPAAFLVDRNLRKPGPAGPTAAKRGPGARKPQPGPKAAPRQMQGDTGASMDYQLGFTSGPSV